MGKRNQLYGKWVRILPNPDNPNEVYLVIEKDKPMEAKHFKGFDDMFMGKDVILTIGVLIRKKNTREEYKKSPLEEKEETNQKGETETDEASETKHSPFWDVEE
jgi:hypothetical protein